MHEQQEETSNGQETEFSPSRRAVLRAGWAAPVVLSIATPASVFANASPTPGTLDPDDSTGTGGGSLPPVIVTPDPPPGKFGNAGSGNNGNHGLGNNGNHGLGNNGKGNK